MKLFIPLLFFVVITTFCYGQKALTFEMAKEKGIRVSYLDSTYQDGLDTEGTLAAFKPGQEQEYIKSYQQLLQDLGKYLKKHDFIWEKPTAGFNRIYFNRQGKIDYFLYSFKPGQLTPEKELTFHKLLSDYIRDYAFPLAPSAKFAQCSPVTYAPAAKQ